MRTPKAADASRFSRVPKRALTADPGFWEAARVRHAAAPRASIAPRPRHDRVRSGRQVRALARLVKALVTSMFCLSILLPVLHPVRATAAPEPMPTVNAAIWRR
jgi:hypothetical protein